MNYYNEFEPKAAAGLRQLIADGLIPHGDVDTRSIVDVRPEELRKYTQCHFFAGIGGWSRALELAGWPADRPVWTGSCPCQPFSSAGKQKGTADERHLWPVWFNLIKECRPPVVFGEQVASAIGNKQDLQDLLRRKALLDVLLAEHFGEDISQAELQAMRDQAENGTSPFGKGTQPPVSEGLEKKEPRGLSSGNGRNSGAEEGLAMHDYSGVGAGDCGQGFVSIDRPPLQYGGKQDLGFPLLGSDHSGARIYTGEYAGGLVLGQCHDEQLGRSEDYRNIGGYNERKAASLIRASREIERELKEAVSHGWLDGVYSDLEAEGYACGSAVLPACSVDAPHKRDRLWFVADAESIRSREGKQDAAGGEAGGFPRERAEHFGARSFSLGNPEHNGRNGCQISGCNEETIHNSSARPNGTSEFEGADTPGIVPDCAVADTECLGRQGSGKMGKPLYSAQGCNGQTDQSFNAGTGFWYDYEWIICGDGKARRIPSAESGICLLAYGVPERVGLLRAGGNAIVVQAAARFIKATM